MGAFTSKEASNEAKQTTSTSLTKVVVPGNTNTGATAPASDPYGNASMAGGRRRKSQRKGSRKAHRKSQRKSRRCGY